MKKIHHRAHIEYSIIIEAPFKNSNSKRFCLSHHAIGSALAVFFLLTIFSIGAVFVHKRLAPIMKKYPEIISINHNQKRKLYTLLQNNKTLQESTSQLKEKDNFIRRKLSLINSNGNGKKHTPPIIYINHRSDIDGELAEIFINDKVIFSIFDNSAAPTAYHRAKKIAEKIKYIYKNQSPYCRFTFQGDRTNIYTVYYNYKKIFDVGDMEAFHYNLSPRQLTKKWINDLSVALGMKTEPLFLSQIKNIFARFRNPKKFDPIRTDIAFVPKKKDLTKYVSEPEVHQIGQLISFLRSELDKRQNSYHSLKNVISRYKQRFAHTPSIPPIGSKSISGFGRRRHPITGRIKFHTGTDLPGPKGAPIRCAADGTVSRTGWFGGYGLTIEVDHGYGLSTLYAHNSKNAVRAGDKIKKGQIIAYCGKTGLAIGTHCHYEVRLWNRPINPRKYLYLDIFTASRHW